jgi:hypothetical protein
MSPCASQNMNVVSIMSLTVHDLHINKEIRIESFSLDLITLQIEGSLQFGIWHLNAEENTIAIFVHVRRNY